MDHHGSPWLSRHCCTTSCGEPRIDERWRWCDTKIYTIICNPYQSTERERDSERDMIIITIYIYRYRYMYICMYIHVLVRRGYTCINLPGYIYIYNLAGNLGAMYELSDLRSLSRHGREKHFEASGKLKLQWQLMTLRSFSIWTFEVQRIDVTCKVVPPSYKLVYKPINYRYITYKP